MKNVVKIHKYTTAAIFIFLGLAVIFAPSAAQAAPERVPVPAFIGDNPSGKFRPDGSPLSRDFGIKSESAPQTLAAPFKAECPPTIKCVVVPAAYQNNNPDDPVDWGNYDQANRPHDSKINSVILHDTEGNLQSVLEAFQNPTFFVSSHYVIDKDGTVYQMVQNKDIAWHAANWWYNQHSIGIEHVGRAAAGSTDFTPAMYQASTALVRWLAQKYNIPLDRQHILGSDQVPATSAARIPGMHVDPGAYWNWQNYMAMVGAPIVPNAGLNSPIVTVAPVWPLSKQPLIGCWPEALPTCVPDKPQPTNFVYLRTAPDPNAPFVTDPVLGQGTTHIGNNAARALHGTKWAVADRKIDHGGVWYKVWYAGQPAWFHSPWNAPAAFPTKGKYVTPKQGLASVPVYGRAIPELAEYPDDFEPPAGSIPEPTPLPYTIPAGQRYAIVDTKPPTDNFFNWTYDHRLPYDQTNFTGAEKYVIVFYNNRLGFVRLADVNIVN